MLPGRCLLPSLGMEHPTIRSVCLTHTVRDPATMLGCNNLEDDLDQEDYSWSYMSDERNKTALTGMQDVLLRQIEAHSNLRHVFIL
jgi:hypothetical protein